MNFSYSHYNWHNDESLKNKSFLITGGAGFIGSHVAEYLLEHGAGKVRILDNFSLGNISNLKAFADNPSLEIMKADITDQNDCKVALFDIDYVCHLAAIGSVPRSIIDPENTHQANVTGFLQILNAAKNAGVTGMVYASSSAVYGDSPVIPRKEEIIGSPLSPYALSKYMNEEYAALYSNVYGFQTTGLRFFNVFGARQNPEGAYAAVIPRFFKAALNNQSPEIYGDGTVGRDFTHVANVVQVCVKAMMQKITKHGVYNVAYGSNTTILELWELIAGVTGCKAAPLFMPPRKGDVQQSMADVSLTSSQFGYKPVINIKQGLELTKEFYIHEMLT